MGFVVSWGVSPSSRPTGPGLLLRTFFQTSDIRGTLARPTGAPDAGTQEPGRVREENLEPKETGRHFVSDVGGGGGAV